MTLIIFKLSYANICMDYYPLSARSSKRVPRNIDSASASFEKSICQAQLASSFKREEYSHILGGERVFIELYYQGRVIPSEYEQWVQIMGGILCKRLNPKVTIFLSNN